MALIKCTECGKEISDSAVSCPHCGYETPHARKMEEEKIVMRTSLVVQLICIALEVVGAILFFSWLFSNDSTDTKCVIGILLFVIGFGGSILYKKFLDRINANSASYATFSPRIEESDKISKNVSPVSKSSKRSCPYCGNILTSSRCEMCGKDIPVEYTDDGCWLCPNCARKNLSTRTSCWNCNHQI